MEHQQQSQEAEDRGEHAAEGRELEVGSETERSEELVMGIPGSCCEVFNLPLRE